jgi:DUF2075 family protein
MTLQKGNKHIRFFVLIIDANVLMTKHIQGIFLFGNDINCAVLSISDVISS